MKPNTHIYSKGETAYVIPNLNQLPKAVIVESCDELFTSFIKFNPIPTELVFQTEKQALAVLEFNLLKSLEATQRRLIELAQ